MLAAQCIWWLASIIQFAEIFINYEYYTIFPSEYINNLEVSPLPEHVQEESIIQNCNSCELRLDSDTDNYSGFMARELGEAQSILPGN
jgi:hypothetical protein